jgi:membrane protease YdiL (CAAX protease family)
VHPVENKQYPCIKNAILLSLLLLGIQILSGLIIGLIARIFKIHSALFSGLATGLGSALSFGILVYRGFKKTKRPLKEVFKLHPVSPFLWFATTLFITGMLIVISELDNLFNYLLPMPETVQEMFSSLIAGETLGAALLVMALIPAVTEELFFRGLILDLFNNPVGYRTSPAKCSAFCYFSAEVV